MNLFLPIRKKWNWCSTGIFSVCSLKEFIDQKAIYICNISTGPAMIINCVIYSRSQGKKVCDTAINNIAAELENSDHFLWLGIKEPSEALMQEVRNQLQLHELAVEDAHRANQRSKLEEYDNHFFLSMQTAHCETVNDEQIVKSGETHVFAGINFIVSVRHGESASYTAVREHLEHNPKLLMRGTGYILYALMDYVVDNYFPVADSLREKLDELEKRIFTNRLNRKTIQTLFESKRELSRLQLSVAPLMDVCNELMLVESPIISKKLSPYFRDIRDHIRRIQDTIKIISEMLGTALDVHIALVTVSQNETVKKLASWAGLLAVPTMFASFWGMNFQHMPELHWAYGYPLALVIMVGTSVLLYKTFKRNGWL
jgi:magnesium transporter